MIRVRALKSNARSRDALALDSNRNEIVTVLSCSAASSPEDAAAEPEFGVLRLSVSLSVSQGALLIQVPLDDRLLGALGDVLARRTVAVRDIGAREQAGGTYGAASPSPAVRILSLAGDAEPPCARTRTASARSVQLTTKERELLAALQRASGRVVTRAELLREVWGYGPDVVSRTLDTHIGTLRQKLEPMPRRPRHIITLRNVGYCWRD